MMVNTWTTFELSLFEQSGRNEEDEKWHFCYRPLLRLAAFCVAFEHLCESCWSQRDLKRKTRCFWRICGEVIWRLLSTAYIARRRCPYIESLPTLWYLGELETLRNLYDYNKDSILVKQVELLLLDHLCVERNLQTTTHWLYLVKWWSLCGACAVSQLLFKQFLSKVL